MSGTMLPSLTHILFAELSHDATSKDEYKAVFWGDMYLCEPCSVPYHMFLVMRVCSVSRDNKGSRDVSAGCACASNTPSHLYTFACRLA